MGSRPRRPSSARAPGRRPMDARRTSVAAPMIARVQGAKASDVDLLVAHRQAMFAAIGGFSPADLEASDPVYRRWIRPRLRDGRAGAVVARSGDEPVGSAVIWLREDQPRPGAPKLLVPYIMSVYVDPRFRGLGIATQLTRALIAWAAQRGYFRVLLHASVFGRSVYRRLGFERTWEMRWGGPYRSGP